MCGTVADDQIKSLEAHARVIRFSNEQVIYRQDDPIRSVHNLSHGIVRLDKLLSDGRRQIVGFALPGDFLGFADGEKYAFNATSLGDVAICRFEREGFFKFLTNHPFLLRRLHDRAGHELKLAQEQMTLIGRKNARGRVAGFLVMFRDRWERVNGRSATLPLPMTRLEIGDYIGLTIETVSREINHFVREKLILVVPGGIRFIDADRLVSMARQ